MDKIDLRYQRGKIYTIRCYDDDSLIYVGSTIQPLCVRIAEHRRDKLCSLYQYVNNNFNGDWKKWYIELYEEYPCDNKQLLEKREGEIIRLIGNVNKNIAGRTPKEYRNDNKEKIKEYDKNRPRCYNGERSQYDKKYYEANKENILKQKKQYREANRDNILKKAKEKVICDNCGSEITRAWLIQHKKSNKCKNYNITKE